MEDLSQIDDDETIRIRIVPPKNLHITVKFLGSVLESQLGQTAAQLTQLASKFEPLQLHCEGIGCFKNSLWIGIKPDARLDAIATKTHQAFSLAELNPSSQPPDSKPYIAHVTVARFNHGAKDQLLLLQKKYANKYWGELRAKQIHLYRSQTLGEGARYSIIDSYNLGVPI